MPKRTVRIGANKFGIKKITKTKKGLKFDIVSVNGTQIPAVRITVSRS
jgi:hypothetical protein